MCAIAATTPVYSQNDEPTPIPGNTPEPGDVASYIQSLRSARNALMMAEDFEGALEPAETVVAELGELEHPDLPNDRTVLAILLVELKRYDDAEQQFLDVVDELEAEEGTFSPTLIEPLRLLGRSYIRARMFPEAVAALEQAQHISQRNEGLFNVEQSGLIDDMTTAYLAMGDTLAARDLQIERLRNAQRRFGASDPRVIPFYEELGSYYANSRLNAKAREQYQAILELQEAQADTDISDVLETLRKIASIDLLLDGRHSTKDRIEEILAENTDLSPLDSGLALAFLGDWAIADHKNRDAQDYYAQAYALLRESDEIDADEYFADPALISFSPPLSEVDKGRRRLPYSWGTIVVQFDVSKEGRVEQITAVGSTPPDVMDAAYVDRLEKAFFRPQIVNGQPVATSGMRFTHYFRYYVDPKKSDDTEQAAEPEAAAEKQ